MLMLTKTGSSTGPNYRKMSSTIIVHGETMDNFSRRLHSFEGAGDKTSLAVSSAEFKHQKELNTIGIFLEPIAKRFVVLY